MYATNLHATNRGQWVAEAALNPEDPALGWGVGLTDLVGAVPGTPVAD